MVRILNITGAVIAVMALGTAACAADPAKGRAVFNSQCAVCHSDKPNSSPGIGPRLFGVIGRASGTLPGYNYSAAMKKAARVWTEEAVEDYVAAPQKAIPGVKMPYAGLSDHQKREDLVAYLATLR